MLDWQPQSANTSASPATARIILIIGFPLDAMRIGRRTGMAPYGPRTFA
jgi:hypothetical protein